MQRMRAAGVCVEVWKCDLRRRKKVKSLIKIYVNLMDEMSKENVNEVTFHVSCVTHVLVSGAMM